MNINLDIRDITADNKKAKFIKTFKALSSVMRMGELEKSKYISRKKVGDKYVYKYPKETRANNLRLVAKQTPVIDYIKPMKPTNENIEKQFKLLQEMVKRGELRCKCLDDKKVLINSFSKDHLYRTKKTMRDLEEIERRAKYLPYVAEIINNTGKLAEKTDSSYGIVGRVMDGGKEIGIKVVLAKRKNDKMLYLSVFDFGEIKKSKSTESSDRLRTMAPRLLFANTFTCFNLSIHPNETPVNKNIKVSIQNISFANMENKYKSALTAIAKALKVPITIKYKDGEDKKEKFPYQSYEDMVGLFYYDYGYLLDELYDDCCRIFDLPKVMTFNKSLKPLIYKGKIIFNPETGHPIKEAQWKTFVSAIDKFLNRNTKTLADRIVLDSTVLGRLLSKMLKYYKFKDISTLPLDKIEHGGMTFKDLTKPSNCQKFIPKDFQKTRLDVATQSLGINITSLNQKTQTGIQKIFIEGIQQRKPKGKISQELFDTFGSINRDWQRIVETETNDNLNNSFLLSETEDKKDGEKIYFQRYEIASDATCDFCKKLHGTIVLWSDVVLDTEKVTDEYTDTAIWEGKSNVGRKRADWWTPSSTVHPWCRGSWARWYPEDE